MDKKQLTNFLMDLGSKPSYVTFEVINYELQGDRIDIILFGGYHIEIFFDNDFNDVIYADSGGWGKQDIEYALEILDNREEILEIIMK